MLGEWWNHVVKGRKTKELEFAVRRLVWNTKWHKLCGKVNLFLQ